MREGQGLCVETSWVQGFLDGENSPLLSFLIFIFLSRCCGRIEMKVWKDIEGLRGCGAGARAHAVIGRGALTRGVEMKGSPIVLLSGLHLFLFPFLSHCVYLLLLSFNDLLPDGHL